MTDRVAAVRQVYDAFGAGDGARLAELLADTHWVEAPGMPYGGVYRGKDSIRRGIQAVVGEYWDDFAYEIEAITYGEEYVMAYGRFSATAKKSRKKVSFHLAEVWKIRDGRVLLVHPVYGDTKAAAEALS